MALLGPFGPAAAGFVFRVVGMGTEDDDFEFAVVGRRVDSEQRAGGTEDKEGGDESERAAGERHSWLQKLRKRTNTWQYSRTEYLVPSTEYKQPGPALRKKDRRNKRKRR